VEEILKEVDLEGYAGRKTNELSGGQKQRVAIARAIVKNPKIIMADEPTGALDSNTGRAILDTLKKLSKDKLVIVVSHDREFAEEYGDRVIELADGEVVADDKKGETAKRLNKEEIAESLQKEESKGEFIKSKLPYKRALKMGARTMRKKGFRLIVTILLCVFSFTLLGIVDVGANFDNERAIQSAFLLGNSDGVTFNAAINYQETNWVRRKNVEASFADLEKVRESTGLDFQGALGNDATTGIPLWNRDLLNGGSEREYYTGRWGAIIPASKSLFDAQGYKLYGRLPENENEIVITKYIFDQFAIAGVKLSAGGYILPQDIDDIQGFLDKNPSITFYSISSYLWNYLYQFPDLQCNIVGVVDTNADPYGNIKNMKFSDARYYSQICYQYFQKSYHTLTYVYQSLYDSVLSIVPKPDTTGFGRRVRVSAPGSPIRSCDGVANDSALKYTDKVVWLDGKGDRKELADNEIIIDVSKANYLWPEASEKYELSIYCNYTTKHINGAVSISKMNLYEFRNGGAALVARFIEAEEISLEELEIYKQYCIDNNYIFNRLGNCIAYDYYYSSKRFSFDTMTENDWRYSYACYLTQERISGVSIFNEETQATEVIEVDVEGGLFNNVTGRKSGQEIKYENANRIFVENRIANAFNSAVRTFPKDCAINYSGIESDVEFDGTPVIVGVFYPKDGYPSGFVINNVIYENSLDFEDATFPFLIAPMPTDLDTINKIIDLHNDTSNTRGYVSNNYEFTAIASVANPFILITPYLRVIGIIVGIFSVLLLGNYIAVSISAKKKEIGILRALGAKKSDIFAIFINECVIITAIVLAMALICLACVCAEFNSYATDYGIKMTAVRIGIRQVAILLALGLGAAAAASAIPLYKLSRKKPIDSIQNR
ncbi:MAG: FtsX-like permease family protein, partial [Clostridia bacterium]|nr:FtsX-like permease family protein [Clostridia bacterium]